MLLFKMSESISIFLLKYINFYVLVSSKPDHPPGPTPGNFLKGRIPYAWAQEKCEIPTPEAEK